MLFDDLGNIRFGDAAAKHRKAGEAEKTAARKGTIDTEAAFRPVNASAQKGQSQRPADEVPVLITTKTCPKCKIIRGYMDEHGIDYRVVVAGEEEADRLISQFHVTTAPTLVGIEGGQWKAYSDIPAIRSYLDSEYPGGGAAHSKAV